MGVVSGIASYRDGSPVRHGRVRGCVSSFFSGGMTEIVYTDRDGKFVISYSGNSGLSAVYIDGQKAASNVSNGSFIHLIKR